MSEGYDKCVMVIEWQPVNLQNPEYRIAYNYLRIEGDIFDIN